MKDFLSEVISSVGRFDSIAHIILDREDEMVTASGFGTDTSILVLARSIKKMPDLGAPAYLGNLKYLQKVLGMDQIRGVQGTMKATIGKSMDGQDVVRELNFTGPRIEIVYQATDPKVAATKRPTIKSMEWTLRAKLEPQHYREFSDASQLLQIVNPRADAFNASCAGAGLLVSFDDVSHSARLKLGNEKDVQGTLDPMVAFTIGRFRPALQLMADNGGGVLEMSQSAAKMEFKTDLAHFTLVIPKRRAL